MNVLHTLERAVDDVANVFGDGEIAENAGVHFTCTEADTVANLLVVTGRTDDAVRWLIGHATGDEDGDEHCDFAPEEGDYQDKLDQARAYVVRFEATS